MRKTRTYAKYLVIDTETTGVNPNKHGIIQFACVALDRELLEVDSYCQIINPPKETEYDNEAMEIHHISKSEIESGIPYQKFARELLTFIARNFSDKPILVGQFLTFDCAFLNALMDKVVIIDKEVEQRLTDEHGHTGLFQNVFSRNVIDTKTFANIINLKAELISKPPLFPITSLSAFGGLKDTLGISPEKYAAHDALGDCRATIEVLEKILELIEINQIQLPEPIA